MILDEKEIQKRLVEFTEERNKILPTLDLIKIREFFRKWHPESNLMNASDFIVLAATHKAITSIAAFPIELRRKSKQWLDKHNLRSLDDGEL